MRRCTDVESFRTKELRAFIRPAERGGIPTVVKFASKHDIIFRYSKSKNVQAHELYYFERIDEKEANYKIDGAGRYFYTLPKGDYTEDSIRRLEKEGRIYRTKSGGVRIKYFVERTPDGGFLRKKKISDVWSDIPSLGLTAQAREVMGYPTQKPEALVERILRASSREGDVVGDFFMGGGTTCAVAQKINRRFIGCDISRVASSVALNRLIKDAEDISGRTASMPKKKTEKEQQLSLELTVKKVPGIHVYYMGVYPIEKFAFISQRDFEDFILTCYEARRFTGEGDVTGVMNASTSILIGSVKPDESIPEERLKCFVTDVMRLRFQENTKLRLKVIAWVFPPTLQKYAKVLENYFSQKNVPVEIELIPINSQLFRSRILERYQDASKSEFLLKFVSQPSIMDIASKKLSGLKYRFEAVGARSNNIDGHLINCQWDFNYTGNRFGESEYALMRERKDGKYIAILKAEKELEKPGKYLVACRVQDNLGGEAIRTKEIEIR